MMIDEVKIESGDVEEVMNLETHENIEKLSWDIVLYMTSKPSRLIKG